MPGACRSRDCRASAPRKKPFNLRAANQWRNRHADDGIVAPIIREKSTHLIVRERNCVASCNTRATALRISCKGSTRCPRSKNSPARWVAKKANTLAPALCSIQSCLYRIQLYATAPLPSFTTCIGERTYNATQIRARWHRYESRRLPRGHSLTVTALSISASGFGGQPPTARQRRFCEDTACERCPRKRCRQSLRLAPRAREGRTGRRQWALRSGHHPERESMQPITRNMCGV